MKSEKGFTLIELIVVVVILGILASVAIPRYLDVTENTAEMTNLSNSESIKAAIILRYVDRVLVDSSFSLSDAVDEYNASPASFFYDGQVPKTADNGDFTVSMSGDVLSVTY